MCLEDVKIGNASQGKQLPVTVGVTSVQVLDQDNHRRAIILGAPDAGMLTYFQGKAAVAGLGYNMAAGQQPLILDGDLFGSMVREPWFAIADAPARLAAVGYTVFQQKEMR